MTGRLKVYDADTGLWQYVDGAGAQANLLRYVPLTPHLGCLSATTAANLPVTHSPVITGIPTNAVAVSLIVQGAHSVVTTSHRFNIHPYDAALSGAANRTTVISGKVAGHYESHAVPYVELGGDRQFDYSLSIGAAGTSTYIAYITGYWVVDVSTAIASGGGSVIGYGAAFPGAPAVNDRFFRTDFGLEFFWNGTRWLSSQQFRTNVGQPPGAAALAVTTATTHYALALSLGLATDVWVEYVEVAVFVTGGTPSAANKFVGSFIKRSPANIDTTIATVSVDSGPAGSWLKYNVPINALLGGVSGPYAWVWTKTGTLTSIYFQGEVVQRLVAV